MSNLTNSVLTSATDKAQLIRLLRDSKQRFVGSFAGVTDDQSRLHPGEGRWSVLDTVEHLTVAEKGMLKLVPTTRRKKLDNTPNREEAFLRMIPDRSRKMETPEVGRPKGRFANLNDARAHFESARDEAIRFVEQCCEDLRATEVIHPHPAAGGVTTSEMLILMAKHPKQHASQIDDVKSTLSQVSAGGSNWVIW